MGLFLKQIGLGVWVSYCLRKWWNMVEPLDNKDFGMFGCGLLLSRFWLVSEKRCIHVSFPGVVAWDFGVACLPIFHSSTPVVSLVPDLSSFLSAFDRSASVAPTSDPLLQVVSFAAGLKLSKTGGNFGKNYSCLYILSLPGISHCCLHLCRRTEQVRHHR